MILTHILLFDQPLIFMPPILFFPLRWLYGNCHLKYAMLPSHLRLGKIVFLAFEKLQQLKTCILSYEQLEMKHLT